MDADQFKLDVDLIAWKMYSSSDEWNEAGGYHWDDAEILKS